MPPRLLCPSPSPPTAPSYRIPLPPYPLYTAIPPPPLPPRGALRPPLPRLPPLPSAQVEKIGTKWAQIAQMMPAQPSPLYLPQHLTHIAPYEEPSRLYLYPVFPLYLPKPGPHGQEPFPLYLPYISPISRLYLTDQGRTDNAIKNDSPYISPISRLPSPFARLYLTNQGRTDNAIKNHSPHTSPISRLPLPYISPISH